MNDVGKIVCITHQLLLSICLYIPNLVAHFQRIYINNAFRSFCEEDYMYKQTCSLEKYKRQSLFLCWISLENRAVELFFFLFIKIYIYHCSLHVNQGSNTFTNWMSFDKFALGERNNRGICLVLFEKYSSVEVQ